MDGLVHDSMMQKTLVFDEMVEVVAVCVCVCGGGGYFHLSHLLNCLLGDTPHNRQAMLRGD